MSMFQRLRGLVAVSRAGQVALVLAAISFMVVACDNELTPGAVTDTTVEQRAALSIDPGALARGHSRHLVDDINAAENLVFTSDGRLLVSGDDGIFEIIENGGSYQSIARHSGAACKFGGMVEVRRTLYANCYDQTDSWLFAAALSPTLDFRMIYSLPGIVLANGLTSDEVGRLYLAATVQGEILRLQPNLADPLTIAAEENLIPDAGLFANGIKYFGSRLYWTNLTNLENARVLANGVGWKFTLARAVTFFDDLYVDGSGILVADVLNGAVRSYTLDGFPDGATPVATFDGPSSVLPAAGRLGLSNSALFVTERNANRVSVFEP